MASTLMRKIISKPEQMKTFRQAKKAEDSLAKDKCNSLDCKSTLIVEGAKFHVCKHQLAHASDYFRELYLGDHSKGKPKGRDEFVIVVGAGGSKPEKQQFQWFLEAVVPNPILRDISDETLETLMRLSQRFKAHGLYIRCSTFVQESASNRAPMTVLFWLSWACKYKFGDDTVAACLPAVARLPLVALEEHRNLLKSRTYADLVTAKLRASYQQAVDVYRTIHRSDHFDTLMDKCPRCLKEAADEDEPVRVQVSPCHKMVACVDCMREFPCVCSPSTQYQAIYECRHGSKVLSDRSTDCFCQKYHFGAPPLATCDAADYDFETGKQHKQTTFKTL